MPKAARLWRRHHTSAVNLILFAVATGWLTCQVLLPATEQPPILTQALQAVFGVWLTNLAYEQRNKEQRIEKRVDDLETSDIGGRVADLEGTARHYHGGMADVIDVQERELTANRAALQLMREAITTKEANDIPVLPETRVAITQLERQIELLALDIEDQRNKMPEAAAAEERGAR